MVATSHPLKLLVRRLLAGSHDLFHRLGRDDVQVLMADDQQDADDVGGDLGRCVRAHA